MTDHWDCGVHADLFHNSAIVILDGDEAVVGSSLVVISDMDDIVVDNFFDNSAVTTSSMKECVVDMSHLADYGTR